MDRRTLRNRHSFRYFQQNAKVLIRRTNAVLVSYYHDDGRTRLAVAVRVKAGHRGAAAWGWIVKQGSPVVGDFVHTRLGRIAAVHMWMTPSGLSSDNEAKAAYCALKDWCADHRRPSG